MVLKHKTARFIHYYSIGLVLFLLFLAVFIFSGFFLHIYINHWSLVTAFAVYVIICTSYLLIKRAGKEKLTYFLLAALITPLMFWGLMTLFGHTYDTSYDGQDYHQSAVIELSDRWNPIYEKTLPITITNKIDEPFDSGYGKVIWSIDSSIYKLTHNIDSTTAINLVMGLLAFSFLCYALRSLGLNDYLSPIISFLSVFTTLFVEQVFTLREDSISYEFLVIGISSIILLLKAKNKLPYFLCLLTVFIFLAGIKDSNLFIFLALALVLFYLTLRHKLYRPRSFKIIMGLILIIGFITLYNPYMTNLIRYKAADYPFNQKSFSSMIDDEDVPINIRQDGKLQLFYYGIFSSATDGNAQDPINDAHIKVPLTFSINELEIEASSPAKLVGGYGVIFSGVFVLSFIAYLYLAIKRKSKQDTKVFACLSMVLILIVVSCLISLVPNYARYDSQLDLFPIALAVVLLMVKGGKYHIEKVLAGMLIVLMLVNIILDGATAAALNSQQFTNINTQLSDLKHSGETYLVYAGNFYSNYTRLKAHGVKVVLSPKPVSCSPKIVLDYSYGGIPPTSTELCEL